MNAHSPTSAHGPLFSSEWSGGRAALQMMMLALDDELWVDLLHRHLEEGGVVVVERWGEWVLIPRA